MRFGEGLKENERVMNSFYNILMLKKDLDNVCIDELEYLHGLDLRLHYVERKSKHVIDRYFMEGKRYKKMTGNQARNMLTIIKKGIKNKEMVLYPFTDASGKIGFCLEAVISNKYPMIDEPIRRPLLLFLESQLPKGYNFYKLSRIFGSENNLIIANDAGLGIIHVKRCYYSL